MINDLTVKELDLLTEVYATKLVDSMSEWELAEIVEGSFVDEFRKMPLDEYKKHFDIPAFKTAVDIVKGLRNK
jgi:hypothetical protein